MPLPRPLMFLTAWLVIPLAAQACSLCSNPINRATLGEEMDLSSVVVVGWLSNPRLNPNPTAGAGAGTTDLTLEKVLKNDGTLGEVKSLTLSRYVPVPDPKQPPRYLVFLEKFRDRLEPSQGVALKSAAMMPYLEAARAARAQGRVAALVYYAKFLDHAEEAIALDAFMEFAKSKDADVAQAAKKLDPALVRGLVEKNKLHPERLGLFAFLLGCCGETRDADELLRLSNAVTGEQTQALDGIIAGYVTLQPKAGWRRIESLLADPKNHFMTRFAALRAVRLHQAWKGDEVRPQVFAAYKHVVADGELADLGIEDLRSWKWWDLTPDIAAQFGRPTHKAPIVQRSIIRYALACPLAEAKTLVTRAHQLDPESVDDLEKTMAELNGR